MTIIAEAQYEAAYDEVLPKVYTEINDANLVVPVDVLVWGMALELRKHRMMLAWRLVLAIHYIACRSGGLQGSIPPRLVSDWLWGPGAKPRHWRSRIKRAAAQVMNQMRFNDGSQAIEISLNGADVCYGVKPGFFGSLHTMVKDGCLKLLRRINTNGKVTDKQIARLRDVLGEASDDYTNGEIRQEIAAEAARRANEPTLSTLGTQGKIFMIFIPSLLGVPAICKALGKTARVLAANRTRRYKIERAKLPAFSGDKKLVCPLLDPNTVYAAFAANGGGGRNAVHSGEDSKPTGRRGRGYLLSTWVMFHYMEQGSEKELLKAWAKAAEPMQLTVVGIDRQNKFYSLDDMLAAPVDVLEKLHVRIYTPLDWEQRWTKLFGMNTGATVATDASGVKQKPAEIGDLPHIKALVKEKGVRATASAINVDPGNLSRYIKGGRGLKSAQAAALRQYLFETLPLGGPEIAVEFGKLINQYPGNLGWALAYRRLLCWSVVPLKPGSRAGHIRWTPYQTALPTEEEIIQWWTWWPDASIGLVLGPLSRVFAIDVDNAEADKALVNLLGDYPDCPSQLSGSYSEERPWKRHFLFQHPTDINTGATAEPLVKGLEFRGNRGLLILSPSLHKSGTGCYGWNDGHAIWQQPLPAVPEQIRQLLINTSKPDVASQMNQQASAIDETNLPTLGYKGRMFSISTRAFLSGRVHQGERNNRLFAAAREMRDFKVPKDLALPRLMKVGLSVGLEQDAIRRTVDSAYSRQSVA